MLTVTTLHPAPTWLLDGAEYAIAAIAVIPERWIDLSDDEAAPVLPIPLVLVAPAVERMNDG